MQITINVPDNLTDKIQDKLGDLSEKIMNKLALEAFLEGLINFNEFRQMLGFQDDVAFKAFLSANFPLHSGGLLNLAGSCADIDFTLDEQGITDDRDNDLVGVFDE
ncbi:hypothetical protein IQ226_10830 [Dolichospermum sp. LEGE 00240]|uniref:hypothetical protein n=1 Tax=Dolichospermum sp. LEGE 00240 TaxID=1828603 RepID=UPI00188045C0|nr:hypothetical protein [Dolichospermum sp. LEGE 00240]MBE9249650.1 hypothetical protein [Dolichospermum sp. LEGE 00240]